MREIATLSRERPLVLIADDDGTARVIMRHTLEANGFDVAEARDGAEAIDVFMDIKPDAMVLDVQMPYMDGFQVCEAIRGRESVNRTPIIMVTGQNDIESVSRAYRIGATDFIAKPIDANTLPFRLMHILRASSEHNNLHGLIQGIPDAIAVLDKEGRVREFLNAGGLLGEGEDLSSVENADPAEHLPGSVVVELRRHIAAALETNIIQQLEFQLLDGDRHFESRLIRRDDSTVLAIIRDVTDRLESERKIHELAYFDNLTGLPNREQYKMGLSRAIKRAKRRQTRFALMYLDLDRFKRINDTFGHSVGDSLLCAVSSRLRKCVRGESSQGRTERDSSGTAEISRVGGDEFTIIVPDLPNEKVVADLSRRIQETLTAPFSCQGHQFVISPSIGIAVYPEHGDDEQQLMMNADTAMYKAKQDGCNNYRVYCDGMSTRSLELMALESELSKAIRCGELMLHYQPKIDVQQWKVVGLEALLRWHHKERGWISPAEFIPMAEETGLIVPLGRWVVSQACKQLREWQDTPLGDLQIAVNISSMQFTHDDLQRSILESIWENSVRPWKLELEITESVLAGNTEETIRLLTAFKDAGISLAIDDFGTGYSSLSYLKRFPLDKLKIDQSFIRELHNSSDDAAICSAILAMGRQLGLTVIAEGVENRKQLDFLCDRACDQIQGFYFSKALPVDELPGFLNNELRDTLDKLRAGKGQAGATPA